MGIRTNIRSNIKILKRSVTGAGGTKTMPLVEAVSVDPIATFGLKVQRLQNAAANVTGYNSTKDDWAKMLAELLKPLHAKHLWTDGKIAFELKTEQKSSGTLDFRCWEKHNKKNTIAEGTVAYDIDYRGGGYHQGYPTALRLTRLISLADQKLPAAPAVPEDPAKKLTAVEQQNLDNWAAAVNGGQPTTLNSYRAYSYIRWGAIHNGLDSYLHTTIFTDPTSRYLLWRSIKLMSMSHSSNTAVVRFYRTHQKKKTCYDATIEIINGKYAVTKLIKI